MAKCGKCDFRELKELKNKIEKLGDKKAKFMESCARELAARLLASASRHTPTGIYPPGSGKVGGTLKRGWTIGEIEHIGDMYKIENSKVYFLTDEGYVYIIYPYGNDAYTNEMDIVIFATALSASDTSIILL